MRSIIVLLVLIFIVSLLTACNPSLQHLEAGEANADFFIKANQSCGWCGGTNYLALTDSKGSFSHNYACEEEDIEVKHFSVSSDEWNALVANLDFDSFQKIDLSTCAMCADGCDTEITVSKNGISHTFTYSSTEAQELADVKEFLLELEKLKKDKTEQYYL